MGRKSKADQRRLEIIQAFFTCVETSGMANASIRKIAKTAGLHPSILHHYFKNREELIEEAVKLYTDGIFERFQDQLEQTGKLRTSKKESSSNTCMVKDIPGLPFIFSENMISEIHTGFFLECLVAARTNLKIRSFMARMFIRFRQAIVAQLNQVPGFDQLDPVKRQQLAATVVAIHEGIELQWFADPAAVSLDRTLAITRDLIAYVIRAAVGCSTQGE